MIKHFTTPEFADLLKQHGIEIDTPFYRYFDIVSPTVDRIGIDCQYGMLDINSRYIAEGQEVCEPKPAYLLSEVLTWLPETLIEHLKPTNTPSHRPDYLSYPIFSDINEGNVLIIGYKSEYYGLKITPLPIEQLITQGLTEGWLTKEIIEQQVKDKQ